jgi:hypothetical protein
VGALNEVVSLLRAQNGGLATFLTEDPRAGSCPNCLGGWRTASPEHAMLTAESGRSFRTLATRETVALQQNYATAAGISERLPPTLLEDALQLEARGWSGMASKSCGSSTTSRPYSWIVTRLCKSW